MDLIGNDSLTQFLRAAAQKGFTWGQHDCLLFLADWIVARGGEDPAEEYRGQYSSESEARRILAKAGGMVPLINGQVGKEHLTDTPQRGDICTIETPRGETGAILLAGSTVALGENGVLMSRLHEVPLIASWRV